MPPSPVGRRSPASMCRPYGVWERACELPTTAVVGYLVPSLRDFEQKHRTVNGERNSSRHANNLRIGSKAGTKKRGAFDSP
jgi:hypothetical protein